LFFFCKSFPFPVSQFCLFSMLQTLIVFPELAFSTFKFPCLEYVADVSESGTAVLPLQCSGSVDWVQKHDRKGIQSAEILQHFPTVLHRPSGK